MIWSIRITAVETFGGDRCWTCVIYNSINNYSTLKTCIEPLHNRQFIWEWNYITGIVNLRVKLQSVSIAVCLCWKGHKWNPRLGLLLKTARQMFIGRFYTENVQSFIWEFYWKKPIFHFEILRTASIYFYVVPAYELTRWCTSHVSKVKKEVKYSGNLNK